MSSAHVPTYTFLKLSYPVTPRPSNGNAISLPSGPGIFISALMDSWMYRLPRIHFVSAVPFETVGLVSGPPIHIFIVQSHDPTKCSRCLWFSPGMALACHFFIISAICSGVGWTPGVAAFLSSFLPCEKANDAVKNARRRHVRIVVFLRM